MNHRLSIAAVVTSFSLLLSVGCGEAMEEAPREPATQDSALTAYHNGLACDTVQPFTSSMVPPAVGSNYVDTHWIYPACGAVNGRRYVGVEVFMVACGTMDGTGCPKFEVLDASGAVLKTYTSSSANQYVRVSAPTSDAIFGIRFTQPTWLPASSATSANINVASW
ncbi:hypothetical protein [Cystobacter fuscus]|uniref:hypothetical protein n=1 Tax=Cystobacter fuscus TaxID=43 RepID=UPI002B2D97BC|nr:hypothetical protein F0U63_32355 [Cystobacter fuscus]